MKDMLLLMARYNKETNAKMMECFRKTDMEKLKKDVGIYYKSVWGTFEHCLGGDMTMFGSVFRMYCVRPEAHDDKIFSYGSWSGINSEANKNLDSIIATRSKVDELMIEIIADIQDFTKIETIEFPGVKFHKPRYQMIMALLTHSTHHRGQIAAALDILQVKNDFSSLLGVM